MKLFLLQKTKLSHDKTLEFVEQRRYSNIKINIRIIDATILKSKNSNGLANAYAELFLKSNPEDNYETTVKIRTLNPIWNEQFTL